MAQHSNYWTCSSFADWLRGTPKPGAETSQGWRAWKKTAKAAHPFRYWLADDGLGYLQDFVTWPARKLNDVRYYINNRWVTRSHSLTAHPRDIRPGDWCDVGNRFLPCLFNELVNFVEVEEAWMMCCWGQKENQVKYNMPWWRNHWYTRWGKEWRCPQAGIDHLNWAASLRFNDEWIKPEDPNYGKPTPQALGAQEILSLYNWWTVVRPARPDPYEASGWSEVCSRRRAGTDDDVFGFEDRTPAERKESKKALDKLRKIEEQYEKEDEAMMIRLIKVRRSLWT